MDQLLEEPAGTTAPEDTGRVIPDLPNEGEVVVRRNGGLSLAVASVAAVMSAAYLARAFTDDNLVDWLLCAVLAGLTWAYMWAFLDSRIPLFVADDHGVRLRLGRTWRGIAWADLEEVEHQPRRRFFHDGRLVLFPVDLDAELALLGRSGRRHANLNARLYGAPFTLPLALTTRVVGAHGDLTAALEGLADGRCPVVEVVAAAVEDEPADEAPPLAYVEEDDLPDDADDDAFFDQEGTQPILASPTPAPLRQPVIAVRAEVALDRHDDPDATQAYPGLDQVASLDDTGVWRASTVLIDDLADVPVVDPVIGPKLAAARRVLRLGVDELAERTRIRPHVIEAIEIDDFAPCGGDFYARGHLRTLARVLGVDVAPLLATYDERYADAPIDPRRVFESELAGTASGPIRGTRGGPNWSVLVAAVMTVVLAWSVARLVMDNPVGVSPSSPSLADGSAGLSSAQTAGKPVPVVLSAAGGGARVVVRDGAGKVVFTGSLAFGQTKTLQVAPPVRIQSSDGSLEVTVDGQTHGALGKTGQPAQDVFTAR